MNATVIPRPPPARPRRAAMKLQSIGWIRSTLRDVAAAPKQGSEGAPDAWLEVDATFAPHSPD